MRGSASWCQLPRYRLRGDHIGSLVESRELVVCSSRNPRCCHGGSQPNLSHSSLSILDPVQREHPWSKTRSDSRGSYPREVGTFTHKFKKCNTRQYSTFPSNTHAASPGRSEEHTSELQSLR